MQPIVVYTSVPCGYCNAAKSLLSRLDLSFEERDLTGDRTARMELMQRTGQRTVPQIFVGEVHVGGFTELRALHSQGKLLPLVNS
ncbi:MAG: glutaredoxin 3 [Myxococcota bacterium]|jgi:glutaredoxin 3|nr:glutaredoxin 3 [Myxococcota bacterium]